MVRATDPGGYTGTNTYQVTETGASKSFTHANGNLTTHGTRTHEWDAANRLTAVKEGPTTLASFTYDASGRRASKTTAAGTTSFVYDGQNIVEERLTGQGTTTHHHGAGIDNVLATRDAVGTVTYYVTDHLGSVRQRINAGGQAVLTRDYDPWGNLVTGAAPGGYAFTSREWGPETGL